MDKHVLKNDIVLLGLNARSGPVESKNWYLWNKQEIQLFLGDSYHIDHSTSLGGLVISAGGTETSVRFGDRVIKFSDGTYGRCPEDIFQTLYEKVKPH